ncbi:hypothetical protein U9M48_015012 [Paspalum notatum var. saurae]|uniref:NB-ARC domain-containing protein n=1 Tax=Paspalum notatum var. saurae TaxID=547442 RepID=A0AAQ3T409_PASNO
MSLKWRQTDPYIFNHSVTELKRSTKTAVNGRDVGATVLPIIGIGGIGKTTIAELVYNDSVLQKHFQVWLWVCVSKNFDVDSLSQDSGCCQREWLSDDVFLYRDSNKWEKMNSYLVHSGNGSSVPTTTHGRKVTEIMGTIKAYNIEGLSENFIIKIIKTSI